MRVWVDDCMAMTGGPSTAGGGPEVTLRWTAPSTGLWQIDTEGSGYDTMLAVQAASQMACSGTALACSDDATSTDHTSCVTVSLQGLDTVVIIIDAFDGSPQNIGTYHLNIRSVATALRECP
jgi:hypothetical protein